MSRKEEIFTLLEENQDQLKSIGVKSIGVFGSVARGEDTENSDCDILVEFEDGKNKYRNFNKLCDLLDETIGDSYDLVTKDGLSPYIGPRILEEVEYVKIAS
jgi:predicted nucleotidyltransferase